MEDLERIGMTREFESLLNEVERDGMDRLIDFIRKSDFYTAPASTRFHGSYEGGLLEHSLNVYKRLQEKMTTDPIWIQVAEKKGYTRENYIVSALFHDICKTYYYAIELRNKKIDGKWEQVPCYTVEDKIPLGHGSKSVFMIEEYMKLKPCERYAVRWHMGAYDVTSGEQYTLGEAMELHPLVLALHEADMEATHIVEA